MRVRRPMTAALAVVAAVALVVPASAQEPSSREVGDRLARAEQRLHDLEAQASLAVEAANEARELLDAVRADLDAALAEQRELRERVTQLEATTGAVAVSMYKSGGTLPYRVLFDADGPSEAGARAATMRRVLTANRVDMQSLRAARTQLTAVEERLETQQQSAARHSTELASRQAELESLLAGQQDEVAQLERQLAAARQREEETRRRAEEQARREAEARARRRAEQEPARTARPATATPSPQPDSPPPSTRRSAQVAVDTALEQVGKPYRWGASGPDSYDCSGLMLYAWRAAGVSLPHSSRMQYNATRRISRSDLQPGDLVFFGSPIHHVAMYIGNGRVVEASSSGTPVRINDRSLSRSDIAGYGRV